VANRYRDIREITSQQSIRYKINPIYPEIPPSPEDYYVITTAGDRYDILALQFYNDSSLWWIIAAANNTEQASLVTQPGVQIRIPGNKEQVIELYNRVNSKR
jgi:hypothetical protein